MVLLLHICVAPAAPCPPCRVLDDDGTVPFRPADPGARRRGGAGVDDSDTYGRTDAIMTTHGKPRPIVVPLQHKIVQTRTKICPLFDV